MLNNNFYYMNYLSICANKMCVYYFMYKVQMMETRKKRYSAKQSRNCEQLGIMSGRSVVLMMVRLELGLCNLGQCPLLYTQIIFVH